MHRFRCHQVAARRVGAACVLAVLVCGAPRTGRPAAAADREADRMWSKGLPDAGVSQRIDRDTFAKLAASVSPAVVNIFTTKAVRRRGLPLVPFSPLIPGLSYSAGDRTSLGTGFIIHRDGYILTNRHVIGDATDIRVHLHSGESYPAVVVEMVASRLDILLLKIDAGPVPVLPFGDSESLRVGDWAMAIGNAFGLGHTITIGTISNLIRVTGVEIGANTTHRLEVIQTDASINPGNSGGPLLNLDGHAIGINTAMLRGGENIGFALSINTVKSQLPNLRQLSLRPTISHGVTFVLLTAAEAESVNADRSLAGSLKVSRLVPRSPAAAAHLHTGDVLLRVNDERIHSFEQLQEVLAGVAPGEPMQWQIRRRNRTLMRTLVGAPRAD